MPERRREPSIVVIGAGMAGITAGVVLKQAGFCDFVILEKGGDVGGVWHWNRYPGLTCDVPSQLYQFSFAPKPDWSRVFASGPEIQRYHRDVVERFGLDGHLRLNCEVTAAVFHDPAWELTLADGAVLTADFVIAATGVLHHPHIPPIPGLGDFTGPVVHTARWDDRVLTTGRRVAVVGAGSTGVQVVSALQSDAAAVVHFARTPQWVMWAPMGLRQPRVLGRLLARLPGAHRRLYDALLGASGILADIVTRPSWRRRLVQRLARASLTAQVRDPLLRARLTPDDEPLCKRQVLSNSYYRALQRRNVSLVTERIDRITPTGLRTADGRDHPVDVIVLATGFHPHHYLRPMTVLGRDGVSLDEVWADGPRAYRTVAIPGFPNLFTVLGPNSPTGSISLQYTAELTARYIVSWLTRFRAGEFGTVEVTPDATDRFNAAVATAMGSTVWNTGCNSWYLTEGGAVDLWPFDRRTLTALLTVPDDRHYRLRPAAPSAVDAAHRD